MTDPSDAYTCVDFALDLKKLGCELAPDGQIVRRCSDGRVLKARLPRRREISFAEIWSVCDRLQLDVKLFTDDV